MMQNLLRDLTELLSKDDRLVSEGKLLKNKVIELALKMDSDLIKLLLGSKPIKKHFFADVDGVLVFDKIKFQQFVSNKEFLPDSYTAFKNKIGLVNENGNYLSESKEVVLAWPYRDCVLEGGQTKEDQKRDEIFWNETLAPDEIDRLLAPKVFTNFRRYDTHGEHQLTGKEEIDFSKENLIVKGNNLLALHSLYKRFAGRIKLIYIDPPYNTGNDSFGYNDNFNHSTWLTFMKNRLEVARELLSQDGSIWISIDDDESHYLKVLCDNIFSRENFVANIVWEKKYSPQNDAKWLSDSHDHILVYAKNKDVWRPNLLPRTEEMDRRYKNPDNDPRGLWKSSGLDVKTYSATYDYPIKTPTGRIVKPPESRCWVVSKERFEELVKDNRIWFGKDGNNVPSIKRFLSEVQDGTVSKTIWFRDEVGDNQEAKQETKKILEEEIFNTPKPERLLQRIIQIGSIAKDVVLDFQLGSGTTAAVTHKMGRQYIGIEQMDYIETISVKRLKKVIAGEQGGISKSVNWQGGGEFIYCELMKYNEAYIHRIHKAKTAADLLAIWKNMQEKAFISYRVEPKAINENTSDFEKLTIDEKKRLLIEILDKNQLYVNYSEMDDTEYRISETDKKLNRKFYEEG